MFHWRLRNRLREAQESSLVGGRKKLEEMLRKELLWRSNNRFRGKAKKKVW